MKLKSTISLHAQGEMIQRDPGFWDKLKKVFGARPNLETDRVRTQLTTAYLVQGAKKALERLDVNNAVALVIDGQVLFEDRAGSPDDFRDLFLSFYENEAVYGRDFKDLRLTVEHREAGLHFVIEIVGRGEHVRDEATAKVIVSARITEFEPRPGEDAETFRQRITPHLATPAFTEAHRLQFDAFVERARDGLRDALPEVRVTSPEANAMVERPAKVGRGGARQAGRPRDPHDPRYDPYEQHYPSPMHDLATMIFWSSMMSWAWHPHYVVVDQGGTPVGSTEDLSGSNVEDGEVGEPDDEMDLGEGGDGDHGDAGDGFDFGDDW